MRVNALPAIMPPLPGLLTSTLLLVHAVDGPSVRWRAPEACPSEREVQRAIQRALTDAAPAPPLTIEAEVTEVEGPSLHLEVVVREGEVTRSRDPVEADACDELADALTLFVDELWRARASAPPSLPYSGPHAGRPASVEWSPALLGAP